MNYYFFAILTRLIRFARGMLILQAHYKNWKLKLNGCSAKRFPFIVEIPFLLHSAFRIDWNLSMCMLPRCLYCCCRRRCRQCCCFLYSLHKRPNPMPASASSWTEHTYIHILHYTYFYLLSLLIYCFEFRLSLLYKFVRTYHECKFTQRHSPLYHLYGFKWIKWVKDSLTPRSVKIKILNTIWIAMNGWMDGCCWCITRNVQTLSNNQIFICSLAYVCLPCHLGIVKFIIIILISFTVHLYFIFICKYVLYVKRQCLSLVCEISIEAWFT